MAPTIARCAGIDISKDTLDLAFSDDKTAVQFATDTAGCKKLAATLRRSRPERIVFEATGPYHRELEAALATGGLMWCKANPRRVRRFADVIGVNAKTDSVDARLLASFAMRVETAPTVQKSKELQSLGALMNARRGLISDKTALKNRGHVEASNLLIKQNEKRLALIETQLEEIDQEAKKLVESDKTLQARFVILVSIPGIAATTALIILTEVPELETLDQRQVASLAGLAPHASPCRNLI